MNFAIKIYLGKKGKSATCAIMEKASVSIQRENTNSTQLTKTRFAETAYSGASGDPRLSDSKHTKEANPMTNYGDYAALLENDYIGTPEEFANPQETLKNALQSLKQDQWQNTIPALIKLMHVSRIQPEMLDSSMPRIYRSLCSLLKNTRPHVIRTVCQVAMELYKTVQCTQRPEFDELVSMLLLKSTHTNKGIRNDAQRALDSMITHLSPAICIRILTSEHGASHKNPLIRATVSRLVYNIINIIGVECLLSNSSLKDCRRKIFTMCAKFLLDGNNETRNDAKKALKTLMGHQDFDTLFYQDVDWKIISSIEKQLISLKYSPIHTV
ncbi:TOG array regulator of axonemal microtubules protein 2-like [Cataglyphis hispanica]|uniref:TOG array regulator of axonemal microtubules protein 2-like n=1 Tax=Cataglyphis hispanica TaxID=1086592 RepID=UPI0021800031|nr:TOG array regulator of axonemal microtubules protein 2-like [Cataglyphis hispanica]